ncbi:chemotaxis methyl-accepting protein methylase [Pseudomonas frederiksbergensis]|uniref:hypothetical protein n=1 Tax=Pseudomonas frederiksbergensis TaxID=104087 RepID=UPI003D217B85
MDDLEKLKSMLAELEKSKALFFRQAQEFEALQSQLVKLQQRADFDPAARKKLSNLNDYMSREGNDSQRQVVEKMAKSESSLKKVGEQLLALTVVHQGSPENEVSAPKSNALKKSSRNFI